MLQKLRTLIPSFPKGLLEDQESLSLNFEVSFPKGSEFHLESPSSGHTGFYWIRLHLGGSAWHGDHEAIQCIGVWVMFIIMGSFSVLLPQKLVTEARLGIVLLYVTESVHKFLRYLLEFFWKTKE